jgi:CRISPR-associated protein Csd1
VPRSENRQGPKAYEKPNLLWDHIGFVFGHAKSDQAADVALAAKQFAQFQKRIDALAARLPDNAAIRAVQQFYSSGEYRRAESDSHWEDCLAVAGCNFTFRLAGETELLVHDAAVREVLEAEQLGTDGQDEPAVEGMCLVTGQTTQIERKHPLIAGVGKKPTPLAAVNDGNYPAYSSHGKHQGENFPVGKEAAFKYSTALNHLLRPNSPQKMMVGDASTVFWAQRADPLEDELAALLGANIDDPDAHTQQVKALFESIHSGAFGGVRGDNRFFVLGLAPNAARIALRFWHAAPLAEIADRIRRWFDDLALVRPTYERDEHPTLKALLRSVVLDGDLSRLPPGLSGDILRAVFAGVPYPALWLNLAVQRCRAERVVSYHRAAVIKACLSRPAHRSTSTEEEPTTMLDPTNPQASYRLGRLFAVLEKIQEESAGSNLKKSLS